MLNFYDFKKMLKIRVGNLTKNNESVKLEYEELKNKILIKLYKKSDDSEKFFFLRGHALIISKDGKWFKAGEEFNLIENQDIKAELISLACDYCNIQAERGLGNDSIGKYSNANVGSSTYNV
ncbi:hypothetical protein [Peptostreptococcus equinus]|uniref:Uncharacterized protein n=1 Tax=Peptostreptococcus equinus TaxID=3003601 RepID=A0ABY7JRG0_9FIRM|nr:hypothetical protein [Peptostreptococcus sp. CBA3647]WAW14768.1 hypothetical protein O0R46_09310 [Peptostreptococcus sp. CBA3647]